MYRAFPPVEVHALDERPAVRHRRVSLSVPGARDYDVTFPGYIFGPAGHGTVVRSVMHTCVAVICDAVADP